MRVQFKWPGFPGGGSVVFDIPGEPIEGDFFEFDGNEFEAEHIVYVPGNPDYDLRITLTPVARHVCVYTDPNMCAWPGHRR